MWRGGDQGKNISKWLLRMLTMKTKVETHKHCFLPAPLSRGHGIAATGLAHALCPSRGSKVGRPVSGGRGDCQRFPGVYSLETGGVPPGAGDPARLLDSSCGAHSPRDVGHGVNA